jgi:hypothetical protein
VLQINHDSVNGNIRDAAGGNHGFVYAKRRFVVCVAQL